MTEFIDDGSLVGVSGVNKIVYLYSHGHVVVCIFEVTKEEEETAIECNSSPI